VRNKKQSRLVLSVELVQKSAAVEVDAWVVERVARPERRGPEAPPLSILSLAPEGRALLSSHLP
jgi:hypothetical protein